LHLGCRNLSLFRAGPQGKDLSLIILHVHYRQFGERDRLERIRRRLADGNFQPKLVRQPCVVSPLLCATSASLIFAKILPRISRISRMGIDSESAVFIREIREIRGSNLLGCGFPALRISWFKAFRRQGFGAAALARNFPPMYVGEMKATMPEPEIVTRKGKPVSVIIPIENYEELLERVEDAGDLAWLKRARRKPLHYRPLEEYLAERARK